MKKIYIGNLSYRTTEENLETAFTPFGAIRSVTIVRDRQTSESRGFGFVEMDVDDEASAAIAGLNQTELDGRTLTVNEARPRAAGDAGGAGGAGGAGRSRGRGDFRGRGQRW